jgi:hypothetical protein
MKVNGIRVYHMAKDSLNLRMDLNTLDALVKVNVAAQVSTHTRMVQNMKANGRKTSHMVTVS